MRNMSNLVILALVLIIPGCSGQDQLKIPITTSSEQARESFLKGRKLVEDLRITDAYPHFVRAAELDPGFALAQFYLAQTSPTAADFFAHVRRGVELKDKVSEGERLMILGQEAASHGDPMKQREYYQRLVTLFPEDERARMLLGVNYFGQQEYSQAIEHLTKATTLAPDFAPAYNQLGYALRFLGQYDKAEATFKRYVELIPDDPNPYDSYAELLLKIGRFPEAIDNYRKALTHNADFPASYIGIAAAMMYEGKHAEARQELQAALRRARTDGERRGALFTRAVTYVDEGRFREALADMDSQLVMGQRTNDPAAMAGDLVAMGNILLEAGKADEASARFEQATQLIQQSALSDAVKKNNALLSRYNTARVAIARGDLAKAAGEAAALREGAESRGNKVQIRLAHELEGMIALAQGDAARAVVELQNANQQNPYNLYRQALAWQNRGDTAKARELATAAARFYGLPLMNYGFIRKKAETLVASL